MCLISLFEISSIPLLVLGFSDSMICLVSSMVIGRNLKLQLVFSSRYLSYDRVEVFELAPPILIKKLLNAFAMVL